MKKALKIRLIIIAVIVLAIAGYVLYLCLNFFFYDGYKKFITESYTYETGTEFQKLEDSDPKVDGMVLAAENDYLKLYTNTKTTEIAVYDKRSGEITYSNPVDRESDEIASGSNKVDLNSQFFLTYYDAAMTQVTMYNYDYSVEREQFELEGLKDGIRYTYLCGNMESATGLVPQYITEERLQEKILSKLSEKDARTFKNNYMESKTLSGFLELTTGAMNNKIGMSKMNKMVEAAGYTQADFDEDAAAAAGGKTPEKTTFTIPLEYRLVEDKLVVSIPADHIEETGSGKLGNITLLSYFGAGSSAENGYMLVPNGSGSLINFNNGKYSEYYNQYVYDLDDTERTFVQVENTEKARMPVFGIKHEKSAVFAEITGGDTLANITAKVAGSTNTYNYVYPTFMLRGALKVSVLGVEGSSADLPTLEKNMYDVNLQVTYSFLEQKDASYSGMANYYRNELLKRGELVQKAEEDTIPFYLDIVGGVKMERSFLAVPYMSEYPMTTFDEAAEIAKGFFDQDISNLRVNYLGWFNGGYYHNAPKYVKVDSSLGGKKGLEKLNTLLAENGAKLYGDVAFQKVTESAKNFNEDLEASLRYSGYYVQYGLYNPSTMRPTSGLGYEENWYYYLSPKYLGRYVDKFINSVSKLELSGISLRDMGDSITSDKRRSNVINREEAKQIIEAQLSLLDASTDNLMVNGGNSYSWAYATDLTNVPESANSFYVVDEEVPFYEMVIHGCIDYTSGAINLSSSYDKQDIILRMIEYGSAPHFTLSYKDTSKMKYSYMKILYSTQYEIWMSDAVEIYQKANDALKYVINSKIVDHTILEKGVKRVTYDNGVTYYINTNSTEVTVDDISIPAMSYMMEGVKQ